MKLCVLYSGGKDSNLALLKASYEHAIVCLLSLKPESEESEVFHYPNVDVTELQARVLKLPLITINCTNDEAGSINALRVGLKKAMDFGSEGVVTGAIMSTYQATRFQKICRELGLWCFNPLWMRDEISILREIVELGFDTVIVRVAGISNKFLGRKIDLKLIEELKKLKGTVNLAGEGGEYETVVLNMPMFEKRLKILESEIVEYGEKDATLILRRVTVC